jgi:maltose/moltooligosaccharide transporter
MEICMQNKPAMSFWQIWNMCFGFMGIQFGFALQNGNMSRIFETLGATMSEIPILWVAAPLTGLLVQPIIGFMSDRTWNSWGRRRPYFMVGAILATFALFVMPHSSALWASVFMLWMLDASINVAMEPFRAFVGDQLPQRQRATGYAMQSFFIGVGSVVASMLPYLLTHFGVNNQAPAGQLPDSVRYSFYLGGIAMFSCVAWTVFSSKEYPPEAMHEFNADEAHTEVHLPRSALRDGIIWLAAGVGLAVAITQFALEADLYILAGCLMIYGIALLCAVHMPGKNAMRAIISDLHQMPAGMRKVALVQFFSWFALFAMWLFTTGAVTKVHFGATDTHGAVYNAGANWVGVLFAAQNAFSALWAICIPALVRKFGLRYTHMLNLICGGVGLLSFLAIKNPDYLLLSMAGVGMAWASILSLPYVMIAESVPASKMGTYMGIFNFYIVIPQLLAASVLGLVLKHLFQSQPIYALAIGGVCYFVAALCTLRVAEQNVSAPAGAGSRV